MATAATADEIRELADAAIRDTRNNKLTVAEIRDLADVAIDRAHKIDALITRLVALLDESRDG